MRKLIYGTLMAIGTIVIAATSIKLKVPLAGSLLIIVFFLFMDWLFNSSHGDKE